MLCMDNSNFYWTQRPLQKWEEWSSPWFWRFGVGICPYPWFHLTMGMDKCLPLTSSLKHRGGLFQNRTPMGTGACLNIQGNTKKLSLTAICTAANVILRLKSIQFQQKSKLVVLDNVTSIIYGFWWGWFGQSLVTIPTFPSCGIFSIFSLAVLHFLFIIENIYLLPFNTIFITTLTKLIKT